MIPPVLADLAQSVAKSYHRCDHMLTMLGASIASCVLHRHYWVRVFDEKWREALPFWVLVRAPSGYGKSTLLRPFLAPIEEFQKHEEKRRMNYIAEVRKHYKNKRPPESKMPPIDRGWRMVCNDTTPEGVFRGVRTCDGAQDIITDEGRSFIKIILGAYSGNGGNRNAVSTETFARIFDGGTIAVNRATGEWTAPVYEATGTIGILTHSDTYEALFGNDELRTGGFMARMFVCSPEDVVGTEPPEAERPGLDSAAIAKWKTTLEAIWKTVDPWKWMTQYVGDPAGIEPDDWPWERPEKREIRIGDEGQRRLMAYSDEVNLAKAPGGRFFDEREFAGKLTAKAARLAAIFHALENPFTFAGTDVRIELVETAIGLCEIEVETRLSRHRGILSGLTDTERDNIRRVAAVILNRFHGSQKTAIMWTKRDLKDLRMAAEDRYSALSWLVDEKVLAWGIRDGQLNGRAPRWEDQWYVMFGEEGDADRLAAVIGSK